MKSSAASLPIVLARLCVLAQLSVPVLSTGCAPDFIEPWEVAEPRLLGVRVEVDGDPTRSRPRLGEGFSLRQSIGLPGPSATPLATRYSAALALCFGFKTATGSLACLDEQELAPTLTPISDSELLMSGLRLDLTSLDLPPGIDLGAITTLPQFADIDRLALFGVVCFDGKAERVAGKSVRSDPPSQLFRCTGNEGAAFPDPSVFTLSVYLDRGLPADTNNEPAFACDPAQADSACNVGVARAGEAMVPGPIVLALPKPKGKDAARTVLPWPAVEGDNLTLPREGCASDTRLLQVQTRNKDDEEYTIRTRFDPSDRETYQREISTNGEPGLREEREALKLTHALTQYGGELSRFDSLLFKDERDETAEISVTYRAPKQSDEPEELVPQSGRLVRFYFTVRDQRGGVDFAKRELCLVPAVNQE